MKARTKPQQLTHVHAFQLDTFSTDNVNMGRERKAREADADGPGTIFPIGSRVPIHGNSV